MRLQRLVLENFGCHESLDISWHEGLNAIVGSNGSGKSTIVEAIRFCLLGESETYGTKVDNVRAGAEPKANASAKLYFEHNKLKCLIERGLRPSTHKLTIGDTVIRKDKEIDEALSNFLNVPLSFLNDHVIVSQENVVGFLTDSPAQLITSLSRTFGVDRIAKLYDTIGEAERKLDFPPLDAEIERVTQQRDAWMLNLTTSAEELEKYQDVPDDIEALYESNEFALLNEYNKNRALLTQKAELLTKLASHESALNEALEELEKDKAEQQIVTQQWETLNSEIETVQKSIKLWKLYNEKLWMKEQLEQKLASIDNRLKALVRPIHPGVDEEIIGEIDSLKAEILRLNNFIATFKNGLAECPTCGTTVDNLASKIEESTSLVKIKDIELAEKKAQATQLNTYHRALQDYSNNVKLCQSYLQEAITAYEDLEMPEQPADNLDNLIAKEKDWYSTKSTYQILVNKVSLQEKALPGLREKIKELYDSLAKINQFAAKTFDDEEIKQLQLKVANLQRRWKEKQTLLITVSGLTKSMDELDTYYKDLVETDKKNKKKQGLLETLTAVRNIFHKDNLPKDIVRNLLTQIVTTINNNLAEFNAPFSVVADTNTMRLYANLAHKGMCDVRRLSGGQKTLLSLAARVAIAGYFASNIGLLIIDEPTAALDSANRACVETVVDLMRQSVSGESNIQLVVVTHEPILARACDSVLTLSPL